MAFTIALSGKGGSGKTTIASLILRALVERTGKSVLAVDADPNATLGLALGLTVDRTAAEVREDALERRLQTSPGMDRQRAIEYALHQCLVEHTGFDLVAMGRPEGPKCYCYVNHLLRAYLDTISADYTYVLIDNEAGMEHLSRRTTTDVDILIVVAEPTAVGLRSAKRVYEAVAGLPIDVRRSQLVLSRVRSEGLSGAIEQQVADLGLTVAGIVPHDEALTELAEVGGSILDAPAASPAVEAVGGLVEEWLAAASPAR